MKIAWDIVGQLCMLIATGGLVYTLLATVSCSERSDIRAYDINKRRIDAAHSLGEKAIAAYVGAQSVKK